MEKIILQRRVLECVIEHKNHTELSLKLPNDLDAKLKRALDIRFEYQDILPISKETQQNCLIYIESLEKEDYTACNNFEIVD